MDIECCLEALAFKGEPSVKKAEFNSMLSCAVSNDITQIIFEARGDKGLLIFKGLNHSQKQSPIAVKKARDICTNIFQIISDRGRFNDEGFVDGTSEENCGDLCLRIRFFKMYESSDSFCFGVKLIACKHESRSIPLDELGYSVKHVNNKDFS